MINQEGHTNAQDEEAAPVGIFPLSPNQPSSTTRDADVEEPMSEIHTPSSSSFDDDEMTEVNVDDEGNNDGEYISRLERTIQHNDGNQNVLSPEEEETYEEQRREQLNNELVRIQRTNFIHFGVLCMLPVFMLVLVVITSFRQSGTCEGYETYTCDFEQKEFMNAFVSRCICTAIEVNGYV